MFYVGRWYRKKCFRWIDVSIYFQLIFLFSSRHLIQKKFIVDAVKRVIQGFSGVLFSFSKPMFDMGSISSP